MADRRPPTAIQCSARTIPEAALAASPLARTIASRRIHLPALRWLAAHHPASTVWAAAAPTCSRPAPSCGTPLVRLSCRSAGLWLAGHYDRPHRDIAGTDLLRAKFNANAFSGRVEGGYRFLTPWMAYGFTPYAAGQFITFDLPAYAEQASRGRILLR